MGMVPSSDLICGEFSIALNPRKQSSHLKCEAEWASSSPVRSITRPAALTETVLGSDSEFLCRWDSSDVEAARRRPSRRRVKVQLQARWPSGEEQDAEGASVKLTCHFPPPNKLDAMSGLFSSSLDVSKISFRPMRSHSKVIWPETVREERRHREVDHIPQWILDSESQLRGSFWRACKVGFRSGRGDLSGRRTERQDTEEQGFTEPLGKMRLTEDRSLSF